LWQNERAIPQRIVETQTVEKPLGVVVWQSQRSKRFFILLKGRLMDNQLALFDYNQLDVETQAKLKVCAHRIEARKS